MENNISIYYHDMNPKQIEILMEYSSILDEMLHRIVEISTSGMTLKYNSSIGEVTIKI